MQLVERWILIMKFNYKNQTYQINPAPQFFATNIFSFSIEIDLFYSKISNCRNEFKIFYLEKFDKITFFIQEYNYRSSVNYRSPKGERLRVSSSAD